MGGKLIALCAVVALVVWGGCPNRAGASHAMPSGSTEDPQVQYAVGIDLGSSCIRAGVHNGSVMELVPLSYNGPADPGLDHNSISIASGHSEHADAINLSSTFGTRQLQSSLPSHISNSTCSSAMPSLVVFTDAGEQLVGWKAWKAVQAGKIQPHNIVTGSVKHLLGRSFNDTIIAKVQEHVGYQIVDHEGQAAIQVDINGTQQVHTPQSIVTSMLAEVHQQLQQHLNGPVNSTVIGLPAAASHHILVKWSLTDKGRQIWIEAVAAAGFNSSMPRLAQEAVLAGMALNAHNLPPQREDKFLLVLDFGATTLDASLLDVDAYKFYEELQTESSFDMAYKAVELLQQSEWADGASSDGVRDSLRDYLNKVVSNLSMSLSVPSTDVSQYIDYVLLVGGGARLPMVQQTIGEYFGPDKVINQTGVKDEGLQIKPEDAVAVGAALRAQELAKLGARLCCRGRYEPDDPNCDDWFLCCFDVAELSIGVETVGGLTHQIIPRNLITPNKKQVIFETVQDGQTSNVLKVNAGESLLSKHNLKLGELHFNYLSPAPAGTQKFMVEVDMGLQNITVTATMMSHNISKAFTVHRDYPLDNWTPQLNAHFIQDFEASIVKGWNDSASLDAPWLQHITHYAEQPRVFWEFDQLFCKKGGGSSAGKLVCRQTHVSNSSSARQESNDNKVQGPLQVSDVHGAATAAMATAQNWLEAQEYELLTAEDESPKHQMVDTSWVFGSLIDLKSQQLPDLEQKVSLACRQLCSYVQLPLEMQQHMHLAEAPKAESRQSGWQQLDVSEGDAEAVAGGRNVLGPWARPAQPCTAVRPAAVEGLEGLRRLVRVCGAVANKLRSEAQQGSTDEHVLVTRQ